MQSAAKKPCNRISPLQGLLSKWGIPENAQWQVFHQVQNISQEGTDPWFPVENAKKAFSGFFCVTLSCKLRHHRTIATSQTAFVTLLVAFVQLFSPVCFQIYPQMTCLRGNIIPSVCGRGRCRTAPVTIIPPFLRMPLTLRLSIIFEFSLRVYSFFKLVNNYI